MSAPDTDPYAGVGVWIQGRSSDVEVDHVEIFKVLIGRVAGAET